MQLFNEVKEKAAQFASENATVLLTAGGVVGTVATAVLAGRAGFKMARAIDEKQFEIYSSELGDLEEADALVAAKSSMSNIEIPKKDVVLAVATDLAMPVVVGSATITAIIFSHRMSSAKIAGLAAAYGLAERNLSEYKAKVQEKLTGQKKTQIDDELAQDAVDRTPGHDNLVIIDGEILVLDRSSGRYFRSTVEEIKQAVNTTNQEIINHGYATASFFYKELGLPANAWSDEVGFDMSNMVELTYSTAMANNKPCFTFEFKSLPKAEYGPKEY